MNCNASPTQIVASSTSVSQAAAPLGAMEKEEEAEDHPDAEVRESVNSEPSKHAARKITSGEYLTSGKFFLYINFGQSSCKNG